MGGDGQTLASVGMDKTLKIWDLKVKNPVISISTKPHAEINYISLSES